MRKDLTDSLIGSFLPFARLGPLETKGRDDG